MKTKKSIILTIICFAGFQFCMIHFLSAQDTIYLKNPSFEDLPRAGTSITPSIKGWHDCGRTKFPGETPPDIHPVVPFNAWSVDMKAYDGETYMGLVVRYNATYESVSQDLKKPLEADKCYSFTAFLARSDAYLSGTARSVSKLENFISPAILNIWGGYNTCDRMELLGQSGPVDHNTWKHYDFIFRPTNDYTYITIEAYYADPDQPTYNGHIMVDNLSPIIEIECK
ncbi:MAG TPA: hypothetical protein VFG10_06885 [Saprospiraceae bacterium]|nr:hypothetical protein [Saprospiraceae bacterium]